MSKLKEALISASEESTEIVEGMMEVVKKQQPSEAMDFWIALRVLNKLCVHCGAMRGLGHMRIFVLGNTLSFDAQGRFVQLIKREV